MTFYITTPIYYVNDVPHLGHAYTTIACDALARFHRMRGEDTRFLTGTDEHGQKVEEAAAKRGLTPQQMVDSVAPRFAETWTKLGIGEHRFIRTTADRHKRVVASLWKRIREHNPDDLYLATYEGWYCVGCEAFYKESELVKDPSGAWHCAIHKRPVSSIEKERSWFFRLSKYAAPLIEHIERHPEFIRPEQYRSEVLAFLRGGLKDLSVSRTSFAWGIPAPEPDPEGKQHVIYVWMDALTNYLSDLCGESGEIGGPDVERYWPNAIHVIGKDILRFHAVYWPAFLLAANLPLPKGIFAHGWWTVRGEKISKSLPATRIDPIQLSAALGGGDATAGPRSAIGIDAMRYFLLREVPFGNDGDFTFESLFGRFNAELANDLGNLINRSLTLMTKFEVQFPPKRDDALYGATENPYWQLEVAAAETVKLAAAHFEAFAPSRALETIWRFVGVANRFIDQTQPWAMAKASDPALPHAFWSLQAALWLIARMIAPVLPATSAILREWINDKTELTWPVPVNHRVLDQAPAALNPQPPSPLFPRLDDKLQAQIVASIIGSSTAPSDGRPRELRSNIGSAAAPPPHPVPAAATPKAAAKGPEITFDEFGKLELRVGKVVSAIAVPKAKKLLHLAVDLGEAEPRSIVAGIAEAYNPDELVGKSVIVVANLAPATIRGIKSEGMILAAGDEAILGLSALDRDVPPGTRVR